jgi:hypothetical protein
VDCVDTQTGLESDIEALKVVRLVALFFSTILPVFRVRKHPFQYSRLS